jgi:glycosyltransferase involved in cell wall biosynthesis
VIDKGRELLVFSKYGEQSGGTRVRVFDWLRITNAASEVKTFAEYDSQNRVGRYVSDAARYARNHARLMRSRFPSDTRILIYREASPFGRGALEEKLFRRSAFGVFDFDDAIHLQSSAGRLGALFPPPVKTARAIRAADRVIAGNDFLASWAQEFSNDVVRIPSCVDTDRYKVRTKGNEDHTPVIGWIGSHSTDRYLDIIAKPLLELNKRTGARILLLGTLNAHRGPLEKIIDRVQWTEQIQYDLLQTMDIGIMPLLDTEYEKGKCAFKLLQYSAAGVPSVGSPVGANRSVLKGTLGWSPTTEAEWFDCMLEAVEMSSERRLHIGTEARKFVESEYSYKAWSPVWESAVLGRSIPSLQTPGTSGSS